MAGGLASIGVHPDHCHQPPVALVGSSSEAQQADIGASRFPTQPAMDMSRTGKKSCQKRSSTHNEHMKGVGFKCCDYGGQHELRTGMGNLERSWSAMSLL